MAQALVIDSSKLYCQKVPHFRHPGWINTSTLSRPPGVPRPGPSPLGCSRRITSLVHTVS
jgi:hypothetical protein